jgi:hypothetical protein
MPQARKSSAATKPKQQATKPRRRKPPTTPKPQGAATPSRRSSGKPARKPGQARQPVPLPADLVEHFGQDRIDLIRGECLPDDASAADELRLLLEARRLGADPLRGDVYLARGGSRDGAAFEYAVAAKRDCLLRYAQRQPGFAGHDEAAIFENDTFERGKPTGDGPTLAARAGVAHTTGMPGKRGELVGAWCAAEMLGKPPTVRILDAADYVGTIAEREQLDPDDPKRRHPDLCMIAAAMSNALRIAAGLNDVVGAEEIGARPAPLPQIGSTAPTIFEEGPVDDLDTRILDAYRQAQALDATLWPAAKVRGALASAKALADETGGDPAVYDDGRRELADDIERAVQVEQAARRDPAASERRLKELRAFDPSDLDADALREYETEVAAIEAVLHAAGHDPATV